MPFASVPTFGVTVTVEGAAPESALKLSQFEVVLAVQFKVPVPRFRTWNVCDPGLKFVAPKKFKIVGEIDITAVLTASVTGIAIGEFAAPGVDNVMVAL